MRDSFDTIIIGAGPSGLFAGARLAAQGYRSMILEKTGQPGQKLLITGGGKCNLTHTGDIKEFISHYGGKDRLVRSAIYGFNNQHLIQYLHEHGVMTHTDDTGRVLPRTGEARTVLDLLLQSNRENVLKKHSAVRSIEKVTSGFVVQTESADFQSQKVIVATGGQSYPVTGSTGDAWVWARHLGHGIVPPRPALANLIVRDFQLQDCAGITLPDRMITLYRADRKVKSLSGDVLFTHKGLTGPAILTLSRDTEPGDRLELDLLSTSSEDWDRLLQTASHQHPRVKLRNYIQGQGLSQKLVSGVLRKYNLDEDLLLSRLTRDLRKNLVPAFTAHSFVISGRAGFRTAMVTQGGVDLSGIDLKTMQSERVPGLYFIGEVMDVDGDSGGYNLQWAWSSAAAAVRHILSQKC